jgi:hypothetical protein
MAVAVASPVIPSLIGSVDADWNVRFSRRCSHRQRDFLNTGGMFVFHLNMDCPEKGKLIEAARQSLDKIRKLTDIQYGAVNSYGDAIDSLDQDLENALGEKERRLGALKQHRKDHGC